MNPVESFARTAIVGLIAWGFTPWPILPIVPSEVAALWLCGGVCIIGLSMCIADKLTGGRR